ncbi:MAG: apiosidase-like domain-containing protein [Armatimonadota bacterium]
MNQQQSMISQWSFCSSAQYDDPINEVTLDAVFTGPDGREQTVPAFWEGGDKWSVRFASPVAGEYTFRTVCSNPADAGLHGQQGAVTITPYQGDNPLYRHGPVRVAANGRHFEHADGTPFLWLGDTWWMGLTKRLAWPEGFAELTRDRVEKGFSVIQIIAGLYPDMPAFDERGANEAGFPWEPDYARIDPAYFAMADRRLQYLVEQGLAPCIVGCWGYFLPWMGVEKMKLHWRYLVARYGAYPVFWCLAGEWTMPYYLAEDKEKEAEFQRVHWAEVARYLRRIDSFHRPLSAHEGDPGRTMGDGTLVDFHMLQTGHGDRASLPNTVQRVTAEYTEPPFRPVIDSEINYEGIGEQCRQEVQRLFFWTCLLSGAAGHTYGANGIWQMNSRARLYGPSPHGMSWGDTPWEDAYQLLGSKQVGLAKRLLERFQWWRFEPHPEWVDPHWSEENYSAAYAAGIPREIRVIYFPPGTWTPGTVKSLEPNVAYHAFLFNPATGDEIDQGPVTPDANGDWQLPPTTAGHRLFPIFQDWVLVLEATR